MKKITKLIAVISVMILSTTVASSVIFSFSSETTVTAKQSVVIDGKNWDNTIHHEISLFGGCSKCFKHTISNRGRKDIKLQWEITGTPDMEGVKVTIGTYKKWTPTNHHYPTIGCIECGESGLLIPMKRPFTLKAGQTMELCFCYTLDMLIKSGTYTINVRLVPYVK